MGKSYADRSGPADSGKQSGTPSGGSGSINHETSSIHYSDWDKGGHNSWDEKGGEVSGEHSTSHK